MKKEIYNKLKCISKLKSLFQVIHKDNLQKLIKGKTSYIAITIFFISIYSINYLYTSYLAKYLSFINIIKIDYELSIALIDKTAFNIIAIVSLTFIVLSLLINNIREKNRISYNIILYYIRFYPIAYFIFGFIIILTLQSTFRLNFQENVILNFALINSYLLILSFLMILLLFIKVLECIDATKLNHLFNHELISQSKRQFFLDIIKSKSIKKFLELMDDQEYEQLNFFIEKKFKVNSKKNVYLNDIKEAILNKKTERKEDIKFQHLYLGQYFEQETTIAESDNKIDRISKIFVFKNKQILKCDYNEYYNILIDRLLYSTKSKDNKLLEKTLESFDLIHNLYAEYEEFIIEN